jgi:hypothetical protein
VNGNVCRDGVVFRVDDRDRAILARRAGVDHVNFIAGGADGDGDGILADRKLAVQAHVDHVDDADGVAAAVGHVGEFAVVGRVLREVVRAAAGEGKGQQSEGEKAGDRGFR